MIICKRELADFSGVCSVILGLDYKGVKYGCLSKDNKCVSTRAALEAKRKEKE